MTQLQLVEEILSHLPSDALFLASGTSRLIHEIASYLVYRRLRHAFEIEGYKLIYECYLPSEKCTYDKNFPSWCFLMSLGLLVLPMF